MKFLSLLAVGLLASLPFVTTGCVSTGSGQGLATLEEMDDASFARLQLFVSLGVRVGANRLVTEEIVEAEVLNVVAGVVEEVASSTSVVGSVSELLSERLAEVGLTAEEVQLLFLLAEQAIAERGGLTVITIDGQSLLSDRSRALLTTIAAALRQPVVTEAEFSTALALGADFSFEAFQDYDITFASGMRVSYVTTIIVNGQTQIVYDTVQ